MSQKSWFSLYFSYGNTSPTPISHGDLISVQRAASPWVNSGGLNYTARTRQVWQRLTEGNGDGNFGSWAWLSKNQLSREFGTKIPWTAADQTLKDKDSLSGPLAWSLGIFHSYSRGWWLPQIQELTIHLFQETSSRRVFNVEVLWDSSMEERKCKQLKTCIWGVTSPLLPHWVALPPKVCPEYFFPHFFSKTKAVSIT